MRELLLRARGTETLPMGFVELLADELAEERVHPVLSVQCDRPFDPVALLTLA